MPRTPAGLLAKLACAIEEENALSGARCGIPRALLLISLAVAIERMTGLSAGLEGLPEDPEALPRAWAERRRVYGDAKARLAAITDDEGAHVAMRNLLHEGDVSHFSELMAAAKRLGFSTREVLPHLY